tara:strand:- start:4940 stop:5638 length:699 start_codon:yes stop_codon:yes gene_type:complete
MERDLAFLSEAVIRGSVDILVLPELVGEGADSVLYERLLSAYARQFDCVIVGGSYYERASAGKINRGYVVSPAGDVVGVYEKSRPYGEELSNGVVPGSGIGIFEFEGAKIAVMICSDFWFSESFSALDDGVSCVLVPAFSITQRPDPRSARELWQHMVIARSYEHAVYVGVSDWGTRCRFFGMPACGVSGLADPRPLDGQFFAASDDTVHVYGLDLIRLAAFREDRCLRGLY